MKNIVYIICAVCILGCSDDFLEKAPVDRITNSNFYKTASDFDVALTGTYGSIAGSNFVDDLIILFDVRSDNATARSNNGTNRDVSSFTIGAASGLTTGFYNDTYKAIQNANIILNRIEPLDFEGKESIIKETTFIRALCYYQLVNTFGDVPYVDFEVSDEELPALRDLARTPKATIYENLEADLLSIEDLEFTIPQRASGNAAKSLLGMIYMFQERYAEAAAKFSEVIDSGEHSLVDDYSSLFVPGNANNEESIFVVEHVGGSNATGSALGFDFLAVFEDLGGFVSEQGTGIYSERNLYEAFSENDSIRRDLSAEAIFSELDRYGADTIYLSRKYRDEAPFELNNASNTNYVFRFADILLMHAEALNRVAYSTNGTALQRINQVRERAGADPITTADFSDQDSFQSVVLKERRLELAFEGKRWLDLKRLPPAQAVSLMNNYLDNSLAQEGIQVTADFLLYPIPEREILNNPEVIKQNPGY